jgi:RsiW-degrading membrane proteinase PrsW (M82 family)
MSGLALLTGLTLVLVLSFLPMLLYALLLWRLDRYEREPLLLLGLAFFWGALPSIILSIILELIFNVPIVALSRNNALTYELLGSAVAAPLIEEGTKALALLGLLLTTPREFDSPLDGIIYGGMVGFGFAAVENFLYLMGAFANGGVGGAVGLAFLRAGIFGLNHAMYTAFAGLGLALVPEMSSRRAAQIFFPLAGFILAVGAHAFHNTFATFWGFAEGDASLLAAIVGDWMGVFFLLLVVVWSQWLERKRLRAYFDSDGQALQLPDLDSQTFTSPWYRRISRLSALAQADFRRWRQLGRYYQLTSEAAFNWHRIQQGDVKSQQKLGELEPKIHALREAIHDV